jgi:hypothetical protein
MDSNHFWHKFFFYILDCDCPDCVPYCSTDGGGCQKTSAYGSNPCAGLECHTDDDCFVAPEILYKTLEGQDGSCYRYSSICNGHKCGYYYLPGLCYGNTETACVVHPEAVGRDCDKERSECEEKKRQEADQPPYGVCGAHFTPLTQLTATAGVSLQFGTDNNTTRPTSSCGGGGQCRTRTGLCCELVAYNGRSLCPLFCWARALFLRGRALGLGWIRNFAIRNFASKITFVFREIFILFCKILQPYFAKFCEIKLKIEI